MFKRLTSSLFSSPYLIALIVTLSFSLYKTYKVSVLEWELKASQTDAQFTQEILDIAIQFNERQNEIILEINQDYQDALKVNLDANLRNATMDANLQSTLSDIQETLNGSDETNTIPMLESASTCGDERISPDVRDRMQQFYDSQTGSHNEDG